MPQVEKRAKISEKAAIADIATSIESLAESIKTFGELHCSLLQANKSVISYVQQSRNKANQSQLETSGGADVHRSI